MAHIRNTKAFTEKLQTVMTALYDLFELAREDDPTPASDEKGKACFQVARQYERPSEFLQALLDLIRANFEPWVLGTFLLNSNMGFLYDDVPTAPFDLGYLSITSDDGQGFADFWNGTVSAHLESCGYDVDKASSLYVVASTGSERYDLAFWEEISAVLDAGFSADDAFNLLAGNGLAGKETHAGYCRDDSLQSRIRLSLWLFVPSQPVLRVVH